MFVPRRLRQILCDFHVHTCLSDGDMPLLAGNGFPEGIIDRFAQRGVEVLNIADHLYDNITRHGKNMHEAQRCLQDWDHYTREVKKAASYAMKKYGMLVVKGAEITRAEAEDGTAGFHIVAIDLNDPVDPNAEPDEILKAIKAQGAVAISAHPYAHPDASDRGNVFRLWQELSRFRDLVPLWEIGNGTILYEQVARERLRFVANSDFHHSEQVSSWKTRVEAKKEIDAIKTAVLDRKLVSIALVV